MLNDTYRLLASVTVVRELYDSEKNVYDVLEKFINEIIYRNKLYSFTDGQITELLNEEYSFELKVPIVKTCLKRMKLHKDQGRYSCELKEKENYVENFLETSQKNNDKLFAQLFEFLENRKNIKQIDKDFVRNQFCDFLLQEQENNSDIMTQYFHEFILSVENDYEKMETIKLVKEGMLLYEGIRYSSNTNEVGTWKTNLNIILDTEILFAAGGYNSEMYQTMYQELEKYLREINRGCPANAPKIRLSYFQETKMEIDSYFESAERIVKQLDILDPTKEAMQQIVNNCETPSDVQRKRTLFFQKLQGKNIRVIEREFYNKENKDNYEFNLENESTAENYGNQWNETKENIFRSLRSLSHINILRKGKSDCGFERCNYIFLTATGRTLKLASEIGEEGKVPLATTFDFLINRFWFKLNKGFGMNKSPRTLDMVMRSRYLLSAIIKNKTAQKYDKVKKEYEEGKLTKKEFGALYSDLRERMKVPSEIDKDTIGEEINDLEQWNLEMEKEEYSRKEEQLKGERKKTEMLSRELEDTLESLSNIRKILDEERVIHQSERAKEEEKSKILENQLSEIQNQLNSEIQMRKDRENIDKKTKNVTIKSYIIYC